jgi:hypothetical protein
LKKYIIKQYESSFYEVWNAFIGKAKNATFLFHRDFMEYHKDRFEDNSLLVYNDDFCVAVLPANRIGAIAFSHQGLSYGGLIYDEKLKLQEVIACFTAVLFFLNKQGIVQLSYKTVPSFYHKKSAEEIVYALFLADAKLVRRDSLAAIDLTKKYSFSKLRKRGIQKALKNNLIVREETDFESFWNKILIPNLAARHNVSPAHSLEEIRFLKNKFPKEIRQFNVYVNEKIVAGTTIFETETTAHCQYISKFERNENLGSLDLLYSFLLQNIFSQKQYFDFGSSNEEQGTKLNAGLSLWKESFGAITVIHDFYELETANYYKLETAII